MHVGAMSSEWIQTTAVMQQYGPALLQCWTVEDRSGAQAFELRSGRRWTGGSRRPGGTVELNVMSRQSTVRTDHAATIPAYRLSRRRVPSQVMGSMDRNRRSGAGRADHGRSARDTITPVEIVVRRFNAPRVRRVWQPGR